MLPAVLVLFALYVLAVTWQMRRALAARAELRPREAVRLLILVSLGVPLAAVLILVAV